MTPKLKSTCSSAKLALHFLDLSDPYKAVPCGKCFETVKDVHQDKVTATGKQWHLMKRLARIWWILASQKTIVQLMLYTNPVSLNHPPVRPRFSPKFHTLFFCGLFTRWMREINRRDFDNVPSGVSHYFDGRPLLSVPCGYQRGARFLFSCHVFNILSLALKDFGVRDGRAQRERGEIAGALPRHMEFHGCDASSHVTSHLTLALGGDFVAFIYFIFCRIQSTHLKS